MFGRTIQVWNAWRRTEAFRNQPWLLDYFDQIRFYPVDHHDLTEARAAFPHGAYPVRIEETTFHWAHEKRRFAADDASVTAFKSTQQTAFEAERARWKAAGLDSFHPKDVPQTQENAIPAGCTGIESPVSGNVWKFLVSQGARVAQGDPIAIIESMKMEIVVHATASGLIREIRAGPGNTVRAGDVLAVTGA